MDASTVSETALARKRGGHVFTAGALLLLISLTLNAFLSRRLYKLTSGHAVLMASRMADHRLKPGVVVPPIAAKRLGGQPGVISYSGVEQSTVLYAFTPQCSWCARNLNNLKALLDKEGGQYRFIGLSLSEERLPEYVAKYNLSFPVYSGLSPDTLKTYELGGTPQTIVISPEGKVLQDWVGAYVGDQKSQVEVFFHIALPGLSAAPAEVSNPKGAGS